MFDPDEKPREFALLLIAAAIFVLRRGETQADAPFSDAERFIAEAERRLGSFNK